MKHPADLITADDPLVIQIKDEVSRADRKTRETVASFRKIGELLIELKKRVPHGNFMREVEAITGIPHRSASRYMAMVLERPSNNLLGKAPAEAYLRKCLSVHVVSENGQVANLAHDEKTSSPASSAVIEADALVVDGTKATEPTTRKSCWDIGREFIDRLNGFSPTDERGAIADVMLHCQKRLKELDDQATRTGGKP